MSDLAVNVIWQEILHEDPVHCRAIEAPKKFHDEIISGLAQKILGISDLKNPDLIITGSLDSAPNIDTCRSLINDIAVKPVISKMRLGVIMSADKLLLPAANSLLKLSEEPPAHACLLFLMEDARYFLPTLKSRSRFSRIIINDETQNLKKFPASKSEWLEWISQAHTLELDAIIKDLEAWTNDQVEHKNFNQAMKIDRIKNIIARKNLSVHMICDLITLALMEENKNFELIFDGIW